MSKKRLLIIEDDFDVAEMLIMYFESHDYEVLHAETGPLGVEQARTRFPNLILLDVMLPEMDGYDVCVRLRHMSLTRYIPILFLTQRDERSSKVRGLELGADDYITKPFDIDELRLRVQGAIRRATSESLHEPRTGLPTGQLVHDEISRRQQGSASYRELRYGLEGYAAFNEVYGFMAAKEVMAHTAKLMQDAVGQQGTSDDFVGIQGDDFVILTHSKEADKLDQQIRAKFDSSVRTFYTFSDAERGGVLIKDGESEKLVALMSLKGLKPVAS
ncbi:MAG: response regulator [Chloroflexi bacterium]|nr:response regulator [Chloroflexota bacterium]